jgi:phage terminase small subunit
MSTQEHPAAPRHLSAEAAELWRTLHSSYTFEEHERKTLKLALEAWDRCQAARRAIRREGLVYKDRFGAPHARPEVRIEQESRGAWIRLMTALKLPSDEPATPQSRYRGRYAQNKGPVHA